MNTRVSQDRVRTEILEQASTWFVEFSEGDLDGEARERFIDWLRTSPEHVRAYLQIAAVWEDAVHLDGREQDRGEMIALARAEANVVALAARGARAEELQPHRRSWFAAIAASVVLAVLGGGFALYNAYVVPSYATDIGEQRSVRLDDGSMVELNARSKIRVKFTDEVREVALLEGQAIFRVTRDPNRAFVVASGETRVRAVGTVFDVYRTQAATTVTVLEGQVVVEASVGVGPEESYPTFVVAGQQLRVNLAAPAEPQATDVSAATAWTRREIVFQRSSLTEVVQEFNRYNPRQMVVLDDSLAATRVSGVFSSTDPKALLAFLRQLPDVSVEETDREVRISRK